MRRKDSDEGCRRAASLYSLVETARLNGLDPQSLPYAEQMFEVLNGEPLLENTVAGFALRPEYWPQTKFEQRGLAPGHAVWDLAFARR